MTGPYGKFGEALNILAPTKIEAFGLDLVHGKITAEELAAVPNIRRKRIYAASSTVATSGASTGSTP